VANAFQIPLGELAGRVPGGVSGTYELVLGEVEPGMLADVGINEYIEYAQDIDVTGVEYILFWIKGVLPAGWAFRFMIFGMGAPEREIIGDVLTDSAYTPVYVNVHGLGGVTTFMLRLERTA
jgi:hypothetical protein